MNVSESPAMMVIEPATWDISSMASAQQIRQGTFATLPKELKGLIFTRLAYEYADVNGRTAEHPLNQLALVSRTFHSTVESTADHLIQIHKSGTNRQQREVSLEQISPSAGTNVRQYLHFPLRHTSNNSTETDTRPTIRRGETFSEHPSERPRTNRAAWLELMRPLCMFCLQTLYPPQESRRGRLPRRMECFDCTPVCEACGDHQRELPFPITWAKAKRNHSLKDDDPGWSLISPRQSHVQGQFAPVQDDSRERSFETATYEGHCTVAGLLYHPATLDLLSSVGLTASDG